MNRNDLRLANFWTETEMLDYFGIKKQALGNLRNTQDLPYVRVNKTQRLYLEGDIIDWLLERRLKGGLEMDAYALVNAS